MCYTLQLINAIFREWQDQEIIIFSVSPNQQNSFLVFNFEIQP